MSDDAQLAADLASNLDGHFDELVRRYQDRLFGFALRLTGSPQDAEESLQDAFVRAYRALKQYPAEQCRDLLLRPWLYRITLNVVRNRVRRPSLALVSINGHEPEWPAETRREQPEARAEDAERLRELAGLLAELPRRYRVAVVLRHVQGLSYAEVAEVLDQPVGTTKSDVHRGLRLLRQALERQGPLPLAMGR